jgi:hypothetical protein
MLLWSEIQRLCQRARVSLGNTRKRVASDSHGRNSKESCRHWAQGTSTRKRVAFPRAQRRKRGAYIVSLQKPEREVRSIVSQGTTGSHGKHPKESCIYFSWHKHSKESASPIGWQSPWVASCSTGSVWFLVPLSPCFPGHKHPKESCHHCFSAHKHQKSCLHCFPGYNHRRESRTLFSREQTPERSPGHKHPKESCLQGFQGTNTRKRVAYTVSSAQTPERELVTLFPSAQTPERELHRLLAGHKHRKRVSYTVSSAQTPERELLPLLLRAHTLKRKFFICYMLQRSNAVSLVQAHKRAFFLCFSRHEHTNGFPIINSQGVKTSKESLFRSVWGTHTEESPKVWHTDF